jgi:hypothetical protein
MVWEEAGADLGASLLYLGSFFREADVFGFCDVVTAFGPVILFAIAGFGGVHLLSARRSLAW